MNPKTTSLTNWRITALGTLVALAIIMLLCDSESIATLVATKAVSVVLWLITYRLACHWEKHLKEIEE